MGLSSKQEPGGALDWSQNLLNSGAVGLDPALQPAAATAAAGGPARNQRQQHAAPLRCPRCHSTNTKFCYYNNYNRSQPRHLCKACRRHWTQGGTLRNVPVGGARKRKRSRPNRTTGSTTPVISQPLRPPSQFGGGRSNGCMFSDYLLPPSEFGFLGSVPLPAQFGGSSAGFSIFSPSSAQYYCWGQDANSGALPESAGGTGTGMDSWWSACWSSGWDDVDVAAGLVGPDVRRLTADGSPRL